MRSLSLVALVAALALPRVAVAQTPSVTPTPAPVALTFRFDCDAVPWSCGDGPNDVRWQLYEVVGCDSNGSQTGCRYERIGPVLPGQTAALWVGHRYKLFLAPNLDRSDRVGRSCRASWSASAPYLTIQGECTVYESACAEMCIRDSCNSCLSTRIVGAKWQMGKEGKGCASRVRR